MKTKLLLSLLLSFYFCLLSSQVPQGINYQALAADATGNPIRNTDLQLKISILSDTLIPVTVWEELHSAVRTDNHGIFSVVVGTGNRQTASSAAAFIGINWSASQLFIKTQIYYQSVWKNMGSAKLWSVPYAMVANNLSGNLKKLSVTGETTNMDEALFEVKNKTGQTVFAVFNEGVRVYVEDGAKSAKGGFAIGGFGTNKTASQPLFVVNPDSIRAYINSNTVKGAKGGFAIGGFGTTKTAEEEYLRVTRDSTRINVKEGTGKTRKGGFAIGGFDNSKGTVTPFTSLTRDNYFIGHESGISNTSGLYNSFFGYKAGRSNTSGIYNVFIGHYSGTSNTDGWGNLFIGDSAGYQNTSGYGNVALGLWAGQENITGKYNVFLGTNAGTLNKTGDQNTIIGMQAAYFNATGTRNTIIGTFAGQNNTGGSYNVILGNLSGFSATSGDGNVYLGSYTGRNNLTGNWNVFIGYAAGRDETNSQRLYIANSATPSPLIYGEFDNGRVVINGNATDNNSSRTFFVNGPAGGRYAWFNDSDRKLKHDIITIPDALQKVMKLRGVNYLWNDPAAGMDGLQMGFIGQEVAEILPEVVSVTNDHYSMQYAPVSALLVEAVKDQQKQLDAQQKEIEELKTLVNTLISKQAN
jgi:hypothetical protein